MIKELINYLLKITFFCFLLVKKKRMKKKRLDFKRREGNKGEKKRKESVLN